MSNLWLNCVAVLPNAEGFTFNIFFFRGLIICILNSSSFPSVTTEILWSEVSHFLRNISHIKGRCLKFPYILVNIYNRKILKSGQISFYIMV